MLALAIVGGTILVWLLIVSALNVLAVARLRRLELERGTEDTVASAALALPGIPIDTVRCVYEQIREVMGTLVLPLHLEDELHALGVEQGELDGILDTLLPDTVAAARAGSRLSQGIETVEDLVRYVHRHRIAPL